jgi:hypothetical protein
MHNWKALVKTEIIWLTMPLFPFSSFSQMRLQGPFNLSERGNRFKEWCSRCGDGYTHFGEYLHKFHPPLHGIALYLMRNIFNIKKIIYFEKAQTTFVSLTPMKNARDDLPGADEKGKM